ncbi:TetR/AcrR family transcriptional regulator [Modestobacter sp. DSM 44400]|uniref:TetR/AcrR family transcriptional regulator n=1 Tax=Modestobacter sp. DSM 44400 TaxID=1550230 RepID=UPI000B852B1A|nr:TetR/AcrR family transcriptional regulator [Modestobacter sp. DSM 44400]
MRDREATPSARQTELLEAAYGYVLQHGLGALSLRPLAAAIGSSPRVLLYLFGSKEGLVRALLVRARTDELDLLARLRTGDRRDDGNGAGLAEVAEQVWSWLAAPGHRDLLTLWVEGYARSLVDPEGPWAGFALATVEDWLAVLAGAQDPSQRHTATGRAERTLALAVLRGGLLDLLATGELERTTAAVHRHLTVLAGADRQGQTPERTPRSTSNGW